MPARVIELIADRLRAYRRERRLSQEEMAHRLGCSLPTYRSLERACGPYAALPDPKLSTVMRAVCLLGLDQRLVDVLNAHSAEVEPRPESTG
ncbi:helix-turn-helix domain-containing protein [Microbacterium sp. NPDC057407]|uniref:helix-turn-helix domain-containing protein n=1 Tax=Microbacterium sp. NPDC057407 TaxID=3346120 RepID=UPI003671B36D